MTEGFEECFPMYQNEAFANFEVAGTVEDNRKNFKHHLDHFPHSYKMYQITRKMDVMYEPLWALHIIFEDIYPWSSVWTAQDVLRKTMDNAIYTYEKRLIEAQENGESDLNSFSNKLRVQLLEDYKTDSNLERVLYYADIIKKIVYPPFNKLIIPAAEKLLAPLDNAIPEPLKQFIDINDIFEQLCSNIVDESIQTVLSSSK